MDRRTLMSMALAVGLDPWVGAVAYSQPSGPLRIRRDAGTHEAQADLGTYRQAVGVMRANPKATDYTSWMYWANSHGMPGPVPPAMKPVWHKCEHRSIHFLAWHRAYLFFFEGVIREVTGQSAFALPYWNWFASKALPDAFTLAAGNGAPNPLYHAARRPQPRTLVQTPLNLPDYRGFQADLESNPHGAVHNMVGGEMSSTSTAARDPVFWAHHCNVDRMWQVWLDLGNDRVNPSDTAWTSRRFVFDLEGSKALAVPDLLDPKGLGYGYDHLHPAGLPPDEVPLRPAGTVAVPVTPGSHALASKALTAPLTLSRRGKVSLNGGSVALNFGVPTAAGKRMQLMAEGTASPRVLALQLKGVRVTQAGIDKGLDYRIYLNLPRERLAGARHDEFYLGSISSFTFSHHGSAHKEDLTFDLAAKAPALAAHRLWTEGGVSVSFIADGAASPTPLLEIDDVRLIASDRPVR